MGHDTSGQTLKLVTLERYFSDFHGTVGKMTVGDFSCFTMERPWFGNEPEISCIPCGTYQIVFDYYHRGDYESYLLVGVPGRTLIKIHKANRASELLGCIAPGTHISELSGYPAVLDSTKAFDGFMREMAEDEGVLTITTKEM